MRVAYVCADPGIPLYGSKGAAVHVREFTEALRALGHEVHIVCANAGTLPPAEDGAAQQHPERLSVFPPSEETRATAQTLAQAMLRLGWERQPEHVRSEMRHLFADAPFVAAALPVLRAFAPDVLIARHTLFSVAGLELARALGCPYVLEVNAPLTEERSRYWGLSLTDLAQQAERAAFAQADVLVAVSEGLRAYLTRCGAPTERILVLANGVNLARFSPDVSGAAVRRRYGLERHVVIGFAGSLKPWHGVELLLQAFASVRRSLEATGAPPHLLLLGDGPQRDHLEALRATLGLHADVTFTGAVPHEEMPAHLAALDIAVAPYLASDGFYFSPLKVVEYLAMGLPVVAPTLGQIPSLLGGNSQPCGLLYRPDDRRELATSLLRLLHDADLRRTLGRAGARRARERFSWEAVAQAVLGHAVPAAQVV